MMQAGERRIGWLRVLLLGCVSCTILVKSAYAGSGIEHGSNDKAWLGGGLDSAVANEIHSAIIDTVPWRDQAGGMNHRAQWGHGLDWFYGTAPTAETLEALRNARGLTSSEAIDFYWKSLPKQGGGRELIITRIRQSYPRLSHAQAELLADATYISHLSLDAQTTAGLPAKTREKLARLMNILKNPSAEMIETVCALDAMKVKGRSIVERASRYINTPGNQESMAAIAFKRGDPGVKILNIRDKNIIGISKQGESFYICRGDANRVSQIAKRYPGQKILVPSEAFAKFQNDPRMRGLISSGLLVDEGTVVTKQAVKNAMPSALEKNIGEMMTKAEGIFAATKMRAMAAKIPPKMRISAKAGATAALFSAVPNMWAVAQGDMAIEDAVVSIAGDGIQAGVSQYVTLGMIQYLGEEKYALTAIVDASTRELAYGVSLRQAAAATFLNYGVATFIFDETRNVYFLCSGSMGADQFLAETAKSGARATGAGAASVCAVLLGANPAGFTVMAVSIGGYVMVSTAIDYADAVDSKNYVFIEDVLGDLPLEMQRRYTPSDLILNQTPWDIEPNQTPDDLRLNDDPSSLKLNTTPWD